MSLAERPYMMSRDTPGRFDPLSSRTREGSLLPPAIVLTNHEAGVTKRQLNVLCLIADE